MNLKKIKNINIPDSPGVYFFKKGTSILYIGKATSLKSRIKSYFSSNILNMRGVGISDMVFKADKIIWKKTPSVLEALILESNSIKKYQPLYNVKEKDDKSYNYVGITKEDFPRIILIRGKELEFSSNLLKIFGPYPYGSELKKALQIIRPIFTWRGDKCIPSQGRPCFEKQINLCPGVCSGEISKKEYNKIIKKIILLFEGKTKKILKELKKEMSSKAKEMKFEEAEKIKRKIFSLKHINDIALISKNKNESGYESSNRTALDKGFRIESFDVAHISGESMVGVMTVFVDGVLDKSQYRKFKIKHERGNNDIASIKEILERRLKHNEWPLPNIIVVDGGRAQLKALKEVLNNFKLSIEAVSVVKNEKHRPKMILGDNTNLIKSKKDQILMINNESHRFALAFHKKTLRQNSLRLSV